MGSYNQTDLITQLPIRAGEEVFMIVLCQRQLADTCYAAPNDGWTQVGLPIAGRYDDYGSVEDVDTTRPEVKLTLKVLEQTLGRKFNGIDFSSADEEVNLGTFLSRHPHFIPSATNPDHWVWFEDDKDEEGKRVGNRQHKALTYGYALVKASVYRRMVEMVNPQSFIPKIVKFAQTGHESQVESFIYADPETGDVLNDYLYDSFEAGEDIALTVLGLVQHLADFMAFFKAMRQGRKVFTPQSGQGSQQTNWEFHLRLAQMTVELAAQEIEVERQVEEE